MKKSLMALMSCLLLLAGCEQTPSTAESSESSAPQQEAPGSASSGVAELLPTAKEAGREKAVDLGFLVEGVQEIVPATLYVGQGYSIYIPDEGWCQKTDDDQHEEPDDPAAEDSWKSTVNDEVELEVAWYAGKTAEEVRGLILADEDDYRLIEDKRGGLGGTDDEDGLFLDIRICETPDGTFTLSCRYPIEAAEGFGTRLSVMADTFSVTE